VTSEGHVAEDKLFDGQFFCSECWASWLQQPFHHQFTVADDNTVGARALMGAQVVVTDEHTTRHGCRAVVLDPYAQPGRVRVQVLQGSLEDQGETPISSSRNVHHRHLRPLTWNAKSAPRVVATCANIRPCLQPQDMQKTPQHYKGCWQRNFSCGEDQQGRTLSIPFSPFTSVTLARDSEMKQPGLQRNLVPW